MISLRRNFEIHSNVNCKGHKKIADNITAQAGINLGNIPGQWRVLNFFIRWVNKKMNFQVLDQQSVYEGLQNIPLWRHPLKRCLNDIFKLIY